MIKVILYFKASWIEFCSHFNHILITLKIYIEWLVLVDQCYFEVDIYSYKSVNPKENKYTPLPFIFFSIYLYCTIYILIHLED